MARKAVHARFVLAWCNALVTRDEAIRRIADLNRQSWLSTHPGASDTDYQTAGVLAAVGMADPDWRGTSDRERALADEIDTILVQIEEQS